MKLRLAAVMHVLFHMATPRAIPNSISESAVKSADCVVDLCLQRAAYLGGKGDLNDPIDEIQQGNTCVKLLRLCTVMLIVTVTAHVVTSDSASYVVLYN